MSDPVSTSRSLRGCFDPFHVPVMAPFLLESRALTLGPPPGQVKAKMSVPFIGINTEGDTDNSSKFHLGTTNGDQLFSFRCSPPPSQRHRGQGHYYEGLSSWPPDSGSDFFFITQAADRDGPLFTHPVTRPPPPLLLLPDPH